MKQVPIRLGPLALLLTVVAICMTVLAILTFSTARADLAMAEKSAESVKERYALEAEGQAFLSQALGRSERIGGEYVTGVTDSVRYDIYGFSKEALAELGIEEKDGGYWKELRRGSQTLKIGLKFSEKLEDEPKGFTVTCWQYSTDWAAPEEIGGLWQGE